MNRVVSASTSIFYYPYTEWISQFCVLRLVWRDGKLPTPFFYGCQWTKRYHYVSRFETICTMRFDWSIHYTTLSLSRYFFPLLQFNSSSIARCTIVRRHSAFDIRPFTEIWTRVKSKMLREVENEPKKSATTNYIITIRIQSNIAASNKTTKCFSWCHTDRLLLPERWGLFKNPKYNQPIEVRLLFLAGARKKLKRMKKQAGDDDRLFGIGTTILHTWEL